MINQVVNYLLNLEVKVIPVAILYIICLMPTEFRKQINFKYTPVYCSLPIFKDAKRLREFHIGGFENTKEERNRIRRDNSQSFIIESMLIPIIFGFIFGIFKVPRDIINPLIILLLLTRSIQFIKCTINIKKERSLPSNKDIIMLGALYLAFLYLYYTNMTKGYGLGVKDVSSMYSSLIKVFWSLVQAYIFSWIGACVDVTTININYNSTELELEDELAIAEDDEK